MQVPGLHPGEPERLNKVKALRRKVHKYNMLQT